MIKNPTVTWSTVFWLILLNTHFLTKNVEFDANFPLFLLSLTTRMIRIKTVSLLLLLCRFWNKNSAVRLDQQKLKCQFNNSHKNSPTNCSGNILFIWRTFLFTSIIFLRLFVNISILLDNFRLFCIKKLYILTYKNS